MEKTALQQLPARYLLCHAYGHGWDPIGGLMLEGGVQEDEFECECGTRKYETWHRRTKRTLGHRYTWPDGYRLGYRVTREEAKEELRRREDFQKELQEAREATD